MHHTSKHTWNTCSVVLELYEHVKSSRQPVERKAENGHKHRPQYTGIIPNHRSLHLLNRQGILLRKLTGFAMLCMHDCLQSQAVAPARAEKVPAPVTALWRTCGPLTPWELCQCSPISPGEDSRILYHVGTVQSFAKYICCFDHSLAGSGTW